MSKIVYVRSGEQLQEIETFGEFDLTSVWGTKGYVIWLGNQVNHLNEDLTWNSPMKAQKDYLKILKESADKNYDVIERLTELDMEVIKLSNKEVK